MPAKNQGGIEAATTKKTTDFDQGMPKHSGDMHAGGVSITSLRDTVGSKALKHYGWPLSNDGKVNWRSRPSFGHTFEKHGEGEKQTKALLDRAKTPNHNGELVPQGQWLNNQRAAEFLNNYGSIPYSIPPIEIDIPEGLAQIILPNGEIRSARKARIVINKQTGRIRTAIPIE